MKLVTIESPYAGNIKKNIKYAKECMLDCLLRGEAPLASHLLYTQEGLLDDANPIERKLGIEAGLAWGAKAELVAVYRDLGISKGMEMGMARALENKIPIEYRNLNEITLERFEEENGI